MSTKGRSSGCGASGTSEALPIVATRAIAAIFHPEAVRLSVAVTADVLQKRPVSRAWQGMLGNVGTTHGCGFMR